MMIARCTAIRLASSAGMMNTCAMYSRDSNAVEPGEHARPRARSRTGRRSSGSDIATPQAIARPIPESRSSGSE